MATFGNRLREIRLANNLTQKELAVLFKLSESAIGMYERDEREPSFKLANEIADRFEVTTDYLFGRTDIIRSEETNLSFYGGPSEYTEDEIEVIEDALRRYREMKSKLIHQIEDNKKK
ncbi:helix-turn-helix transcriptional regulator [Paenibacillus sp. FSL E2-0177]|uniref:helix-turn-helix domain-containing protein n=1 Tax=Paenibacillus sp. FSL E2-0177 TaxID=2921360 RepID=UPI0030ED7E67